MSQVLAQIDPELARLLGRTASLSRRAPARQPMSDQEERSLVGSLRSGAINTAGAVGNFLDLPGSVVRDTVNLFSGGRRGDRNPLDQLLPWNWFSSEGRTTGRDIARNMGLARSRDTTGNFWGGGGIERGHDPLTYLSLGASAVGKAGQVAKRAGLLDDAVFAAAKKAGKPVDQIGRREAMLSTTLDDLLKYGGDQATAKAHTAAQQMGTSLDAVRGEQLGGLFGAGLPFSAPSAVLGTGAKSQAAARRLDKIGTGIRRAAIPGTEIRPIDAGFRLFDAALHGTKSALVQRFAKRSFDEKIAAMGDVQLEAVRLGNELKTAGVSDEAAGDLLRMMMEGVRPADVPSTVRAGIDETLKRTTPEQLQVMQKVANDARDLIKPMIEQGKAIGKKTEELTDDYIDYFPRFIAEVLGHKPARDKAFISAADSSQIGRLDVFRDIPGGTIAAKEIARDPELAQVLARDGVKTEDVAKFLEAKHGSWLPDSYRMFKETPGGGGAGEWVRKETGRYKALAKRLGSYAPETLESGIFGNHPLKDLNARLLASKNADVSIETLADVLSQPGVVKLRGDAIADARDTVQLMTLAKEVGLKWGKSDEAGGFGEYLFKKLGLTGDVTTGELGKAVVSREIANDVRQYMKQMTGSDELDEWLKIVDGVTNFGKGMWTSIWPAFHVRNRMSGLAWNFMKGITSRQAESMAGDYMKGRAVAGLRELPAIRDEWARRQAGGELVDEALAARVQDVASAPVGGSHSLSNETFPDLLIRRQDWAGRDVGAKGVQVPDALVVARVQSAVPGRGDFRRLHNTLAGTGKRVVVEEATPEFGAILDGMGYRKVGNSYVFDPADAPGLTDDMARRILGEMASADGILSRNNQATDVTATIAQTEKTAAKPGSLSEMLSSQVDVGDPAMRLGRVAQKASGLHPDTQLNPLKAQFRGVRGATESTWGPLAAGEEIGHYVEGRNRLAPYIELLRRGTARDEAAKLVGQAQVQYSNRYFTPFEQQIMKRLIPFWSFSSRMGKQVVSELAQRPGGPLGATIRTQRLAHQDAETAPDYVRDTASIPLGNILGQLPAGTDRYLAGFGMMHEDPLSFGPDARSAGLEVLSRMNPFVKGPLEYFTGQSFFQKSPSGGRPLEDLDPLVGRLLANVTGEKKAVQLPQWLETAVANSPAARALTTVRQLTDERKAIPGTRIPGPAALANILTGVRVSDISPGAKEAVIRELVREDMLSRGAGKFERLYFRPDDLAAMSPKERAEAQRLQDLLSLWSKRQKERRKAESK